MSKKMRGERIEKESRRRETEGRREGSRETFASTDDMSGSNANSSSMTLV